MQQKLQNIDESMLLENKRTYWKCDESKNFEFFINNFGSNTFL